MSSLVLLVALGCTGAAESPGVAVANDVVTTATLEGAAAVETARAFLEAYATPPSADDTHRTLVAGTDLEEWVYWVGVQNSGLELLPRGVVDIRALRLLSLEGSFATVALDAVVSIPYRNDEGEVVKTERRFTSPMVLARVEDRGWRVVDVVRDGRPMGASIATLEPPAEATAGPAVVDVASVFRFTAGTFVNVRILNRGETPLRVDPERSILVVAGVEGEGTAMTASLAGPIAPGEEAQGGLTFPAIPLTAAPDGVAISFSGERPVDVAVALPEEAFTLPTDQSTSNSVGDGVSAA